MANAFISADVMALLEEDRAIFDKVKNRENPFNIKVPDGNYAAILAKCLIKKITKGGKSWAKWTFTYLMVANSDTGKTDGVVGAQVQIRHEMNATDKRSKEEAWEYLTYDLKSLGIANVSELTPADFEDVLRGLNTKRKAVLISIVTKDGYKNGRLREVVKYEAIKKFITPEVEQMLAEVDSQADEPEEGEDNTPTDQFATMDRAQMIETNKKYELGIKSKGMSDDDFRNALRTAVAAKLEAARKEAEGKPPFEEEGEEEEEEGEEEGDDDPTLTMTRADMVKMNKDRNFGIKSKDKSDDWFREQLRAKLAESAPADDPNEE